MGNLCCAREHSVQFFVQFLYTVKLCGFNLECIVPIGKVEFYFMLLFCRHVAIRYTNIIWQLQLKVILMKQPISAITDGAKTGQQYHVTNHCRTQIYIADNLSMRFVQSYCVRASTNLCLYLHI